MEQALYKLAELGIEVSKARKAIEAVLEAEDHNIDEGQLVIKAIQVLSGRQRKRSLKK